MKPVDPNKFYTVDTLVSALEFKKKQDIAQIEGVICKLKADKNKKKLSVVAGSVINEIIEYATFEDKKQPEKDRLSNPTTVHNLLVNKIIMANHDLNMTEQISEQPNHETKTKTKKS